MKRRIVIALLAIAPTATLAPTAFGHATGHDPVMANLLARSHAATASPGKAFYVSGKGGQLDPWILNLIARKGYRVVSPR